MEIVSFFEFTKNLYLNRLENYQLKKDFVEKSLRIPMHRKSGSLTGLNMWSKLLDDKQIKDFFRCEQGTPVADIFDWNNAEMIT